MTRHVRNTLFVLLPCLVLALLVSCSTRRGGGSGGGAGDDDDDDSANCDLCACWDADLTVVAGCEGWADAESCSAWNSLLDAQGLNPGTRLCDGTELAWIGGGGECVIRLDCWAGGDDDSAMR